jgi:hypothetical protein
MDWRLQVLKQTALARVPFGDALRRLKRRWFGYRPDPENLRVTRSNLDQMSTALAALGRSFDGATVLEIGSGWFPTIPIMLALGGAKRIVMTDLTPHMDDATFAATVGFLRSDLPAERRLDSIARCSDLPITYLAPFNVDRVPDGTVDYIISRTVLEHISPSDLVHLFIALRPKLTNDGMMVHVVDNSDHLEHNDKAISRINFLTWTARKHAAINFLLRSGENRLRHHEYPPLFESAGFRVVSASCEIHEPTRGVAKSLPLTSPYANMTADQLAALSSIYVLAPSPAPGSHANHPATRGE